MSDSGARARIRRADPTLRAGEDRGGSPARDLSRPQAGLLAALFSAVLVIPWLRRLRRRAEWNWIRSGLLVAAAAVAALGPEWSKLPALLAALLAVALRRTPDPDGERRIQRMHHAEYFLNGGEWAGQNPPDDAEGLRAGTAVYLLLRGPHLLVIRRDRHDRVEVALRVDSVERILVDGRDYVPVFVSEAKRPPRREREVDRHAVSDLSLEIRDGAALRFRYRGAFSLHLAETAAHAVCAARSGV